jgi:quinol monooxygenase YgiN
MLGVIAKLPIQEGKVDEAIEAIKGLMVDVAKEEGTLLYTLNRDKKNPNQLIFMERYTDKEALDFHGSTPYFKAFGGKLPSLLAGTPEITVLEEVASHKG